MSDQEFKSFVPAETDMREFSSRALIIGLGMCVVLGAANAYLGLKAGMTIAATYPAAVIGMALLKLCKGSVLEENFARTVGSIGESVAAGAIFTIPAFVILKIWHFGNTPAGQKPHSVLEEYLLASALMVLGGILGIMFVTILRRVMVEDKTLPFPESVAASEIHKAGQRGSEAAMQLFRAMGVGALIKILGRTDGETFDGFGIYYAVHRFTFHVGKLKDGFVRLAGGRTVAAGGVTTFNAPAATPAYIGVGYIIGPELGALNFAGGLLAWGLFVPLLVYFLGPSQIDSYGGDWGALVGHVYKFIVRPIAVGGMLVGACYTLWKMRANLILGIKRGVANVKKSAAAAAATTRTQRDLSFKNVLLIIGVLLVLMICVYFFFTSTKAPDGTATVPAPLFAAIVAGVVILITGFLFAAVSGNLVGMIGSSNNPISGLTLATTIVAALTMVIVGAKGMAGVAAVLGVAAIGCVSAAVAGEMLQDLKVGHILGGTPWKMQIGDMIGVVVAGLVMFFPLYILHNSDIKQAAAHKAPAAIVATTAPAVPAAPAAAAPANPAAPAEAAAAPAGAPAAAQTAPTAAPATPAPAQPVAEVEGGFGGKNLPAPQAGLMAALSQGIVGGEMAWPLVIVGIAMGIALILIKVKSPMLFSVGMYLPLETTFAIFIGGLIRGVVDKVVARRQYNPAQKARVENAGVLAASGLIAGEALMGLVIAAVVFFFEKFPSVSGFDSAAPWMALPVFAVLAIYLIMVPLKKAGSADEPAPPTAVM